MPPGKIIPLIRKGELLEEPERSGDRWVAVALFALAGLLCAIALASPPPGVFRYLLALLVAGLAAAIALRSGVVYDRARGVIRLWQRFLWYYREREIPLGQFARLEITPRAYLYAHTTGPGYTAFALHLLGAAGESYCVQPRFMDAQGARVYARELSAFLGLPVEDRSGEAPVNERPYAHWQGPAQGPS